MDLKTVRIFGTRGEAEIARGYLEANDVKAVIKFAIYPELAVSDGVEVQVPEDQLARAKSLLDHPSDD